MPATIDRPLETAAYRSESSLSKQLFERATKVMPGGNTRTTLHYGPFPITVRSAKGSRVTDVDGHTYVDFINEHTAGVFGHSEPVIQGSGTLTASAGPGTWSSSKMMPLSRNVLLVESWNS